LDDKTRNFFQEVKLGERTGFVPKDEKLSELLFCKNLVYFEKIEFHNIQIVNLWSYV